ncbi:MAG: dihydroorotase [Alloprevotella sp.]|nr:dihydroorotase [Alloprevotella sp.]
MHQRILIKNALIVNEGNTFCGSLVIDNEQVAEILLGREAYPSQPVMETIDADGCYLLPGIIDSHVHFRDPGLTHKADFESESLAALAGGVTTVLDMPNTLPETTTVQALENKIKNAQAKSHINFGFLIGASNNNADSLADMPLQKIAAIKIFLGSSTGNMQIEDPSAVERFFQHSPTMLVAHCEDSSIIRKNLQHYQRLYGEDPDIQFHSKIRSAEACINSTRYAIRLAQQYHTHLHIAHISTKEELELIHSSGKEISAEVCLPHLLFCEDDYAQLGSRIKCNPSVKTQADREALRKALSTDKICTIATDHAPHTKADKVGGAAKAKSGIPLLQFSLVSMLGLVDEGYLSIERLVQLMCHNPATLYGIENRGFLRIGYKADIVLVRPQSYWTLTPNDIRSKCHWSPLEGHTFHWQVEKTFCNGSLVFDKGAVVNESRKGQPVTFNH